MSVVLPASGCEMIAKVRRRATSRAIVMGFGGFARPGRCAGAAAGGKSAAGRYFRTPGPARPRGAQATGKRRVASRPWPPGPSSSARAPSCSSAMRATIESPSPLPSASPASRRAKRRRACSRWPAGMPGPASRTVRSAWPPWRDDHDGDGRVRGRVADGVVEEVPHGDGREPRVARGHGAFVALQGKRDALRQRLRRALGEGVGRDAAQVEGRGGGLPGAVLQAREREELLDHVRGALARGEGVGDGAVALGGLPRALRDLQLGAKRGKRRAQLVRRVAREAALPVEGGLHPGEERVEAGHEGRDLRGHLALERGEVGRVAARDLVAQPGERPQRAAGREPDEQGEERQRHRQRLRERRDDVDDHVPAGLDRVAHLHQVLALGIPQAEDAPVAALRLHGREAAVAFGEAGGGRVGRVQQEPAPVLPDLEGEGLRVLVQDRRVLRVDLLDVLAHAHREERRVLRELGVEDFLHLVVGLDRGRDGHGHPGDREPRQQDGDEAPAHAREDAPHARSFGIR